MMIRVPNGEDDGHAHRRFLASMRNSVVGLFGGMALVALAIVSLIYTMGIRAEKMDRQGSEIRTLQEKVDKLQRDTATTESVKGYLEMIVNDHKEFRDKLDSMQKEIYQRR